MNSYFVDVVRPAGYLHSRVFDDVAMSYRLALQEAGMYSDDGRPIIFGANLCDHYCIPLEQNAVVVNLEAHSSPWMTTAYLDLLRAHAVLDYSLENVEWLRARGVNAHWCPIRYHPHLTRLELRAEEDRDIDILFYGGMTPRRFLILTKAQVDNPGRKVVMLNHDGWDERDGLIERAKIVVNIHAYDDAPLEMVRLSYLLANRAFIISEGPAESWCKDFVMFQSAKSIATACWLWLRDPQGRQVVAERGYQEFSQMPQSECLLAALEGL